ncbi:S9 family peptidase [Zavarzinella formosa]|uniref:S9 family peptidase n=1 Tax=Zavarzinella formosa TaxID=360055 RepID=UPI0003123A62|nr:prolyl oligopeptidase family serine peptidase [Zavarzinella formosa]
MRTLLIALVVISSAVAQERTHVVTPGDYFSLNTITEAAISPDGKHVAYALATWDKNEETRKTDVWIVAYNGSISARRLTFDRANERQLKWSADGDAIYCLGNRKRAAETKPPYDGTTQVWKIKLARVLPDVPADLEGREPVAVTREPGGVSAFDYAPLADVVFFTKDRTQSDDEDGFAKLRATYDKVEYGHGVRKVSELHRLDVRSWQTEKIADEKRFIREFAASPDGKRVAMISAFDDTVVKSEGESRVDVWEAGKVVTPPTEPYRAKAATPYAWLDNLAWSADGQHYAFTEIHDGYPAEIVIGSRKENTWQTSVLPRKSHRFEVRGYGTPLRWHGNNLYFITEQSAVNDIKVWSPKVTSQLGADNTLCGPGAVVYAFDIGPVHADTHAEMVAVRGDANGFPVLTYATSKGRQTLVDPNPHTRTWKLPSIKHVTWKAPDGSTVGGVLELPPTYQKGEKLPLVVAIHGGPTTSTKADLSFDPHNGRLYFATAGYAVLLPNYRGSTGYGDKFLTDLIGNENDLDVKDIWAGVEHLVKEGIADSDRVACMGWSNGGFLTNCLITHKDSPVKFRAASSGAGILDTVAEWGFNDEPAYAMVFKKGLPWEQPDLYRKTSPLYGLGNVTTPTLIHVGGGDERCPPGHSRMLFRGLREYKKIPTELVVYTGEPHGLSKMSNRRAKMEWDLAWFEKYLKPVEK